MDTIIAFFKTLVAAQIISGPVNTDGIGRHNIEYGCDTWCEFISALIDCDAQVQKHQRKSPEKMARDLERAKDFLYRAQETSYDSMLSNGMWGESERLKERYELVYCVHLYSTVMAALKKAGIDKDSPITEESLEKVVAVVETMTIEEAQDY